MILAVYYFIPPPLRVSTRVCLHQGDAMVGTTLRYTLCVCYVKACFAPFCLVTLLSA
jgi:hypothetical protein